VIELYTDPKAMYPLLPDDTNGTLAKLALELIEKSAKLSGILHVHTREAIADFLRPMNSYYSNLIEGHDTHPLDISRALNNDYSDDKEKRNLQLEAFAHIKVHRSITEKYAIDNTLNPYTADFIKTIHTEFYDHLPLELREVVSEEETPKTVLPGKYREGEVKVGKHIAPAASSVVNFMSRFETKYSETSKNTNAKTTRLIAIAAAHHRFVWVHPFLDGNGRVVRLFSDACFMAEGLNANGLWSISRGLAKHRDEYRSRLANADLGRYNDYDGRGNLSNRFLVEFCEFFLKTSIDQIDFMSKCIDIDTMLKRIEGFSTLLETRGILSAKAKYILTEVFLRGKISKTDAMRITHTSDKTLKNIADKLIELGLLEARKESTTKGIAMIYYAKYPINFSPILFPGLYPTDKEMDLLASF
jgi:Fic family protein